MKIVLVTGASGFLGRALTAKLLDDGAQVHALLRPASDAENLRGFKSRLSLHRSDGSFSSLRRILLKTHPEIVFHLAAETSPENFDALAESNFLFAGRLAQSCLEARVGVLVATGTYWQRRGGGDADPTNLYAALKHCQEELLRWHGLATPLRTATVVLYDVYGPDDRRGKVLQSLAAAAESGRPLDLSPGRQLLEFVYVDDVISALLRAARLLQKRPAFSGSTWHAPSARALSLRDLVAALSRLLGPVPARWGARSYRPRETMRPWRGPAVPGWRPRVSLTQGLRLCFKNKS